MNQTTAKMPTTVYLLALCQALLMSGSTLMITSSALVGMTLTENKSLVTVPISLQYLGQMLTSIPASLLMGRYGRRAGFLVGASFGILGGALTLLAVLNTHFGLFCVATFCIGIFNGFGTYFRFAAVDVVSEFNRPKAISYVMLGGVIAAFIGPNLVNYGTGIFKDFPFAGGFLFVTIIYCLAFVTLFFVDIPVPLAQKNLSAGRPMRQIAAQPTFIVAVICGMLGYGVMTYVMTATPLAMQHHQHNLQQTSFVIQWHVLAMFAPSYITGDIIQIIGVLRVLLIGAILAVVCMLVNLLGHSMWHFSIALVALGLSWNFLFIGASTLLTETYNKAETAKAQALNDFLVFSTVTMASLSAGYFQNNFGWQSVNIGAMALVVVILLSLLWLISIPREKRLSPE